MFNFFKKDTKNLVIEKAVVLTEEEIKTLQIQLLEKHNTLSSFLNSHERDENLIAKLYEEMGLLSVDIDKEQAINYLENSLSYKPSIGEGYKCLMNLYNQKRAEAAKNGDGNGIEKWMNKMDEMRQISKKMILLR